MNDVLMSIAMEQWKLWATLKVTTAIGGVLLGGLAFGQVISYLTLKKALLDLRKDLESKRAKE